MVNKNQRIILANDSAKKIELGRINNKKKKIKKKWSRKKKIVILLIIFFLSGISFFSWRVWSSLEKIFSNGLNPFTVLANLKPTALAGEGDGRTNILLLGSGDPDWPGADLTDTIMVASINTRDNSALLISIPRDFYVKINNHGWDKINSAYVYGEQYKKGDGPQTTLNAVSDILDIPIHYYAKVDFTAFKKAIDAVGGVSITPSEDLYDPHYPGGTVNFDGGKTYSMNGDTALKYARSRQTTSDFDRARRQQEVMISLKEKALSLGTLSNPKTVLDLIGIMGDHVRTNLQPNEIKRIMDISKKMDSGKINSVVIDGENTKLVTTGMIGDASCVFPVAGIGKYADIQDYVYDLLSNKKPESNYKDENASILIENGTTIAGLATTAKTNLEDEGYLDLSVGNADSQDYSKTRIIDYSGGKKSASIKNLEKYFGITAAKATGSDYDIVIIVGKDYATKN
ncbi:MAG: LytR family transcriptional protein [candidate division CPR2 bacterium GW2011_GWC1_39_9]|uniref:LytR family transcriptional protein n=1 Tax=candidate division CPR2 bacterium GW2011_GWC2_39_10 TaxID=1618345 RepID=A0A0G0M4L6_UNCC2|nr:MAG: LytR family transcriptional protein [candidate division CPR2 bacterium GW2011_GWC2_39_10]KKR34346.1 MAG: LytR family transcriptional protein [candidate division CPR2 bacterium GW2011_GWC1_39_9]